MSNIFISLPSSGKCRDPSSDSETPIRKASGLLEGFFRQHFENLKIESIDSIMTEKPGEKTMTPLSLVTFASNRVREDILRGLRSQHLSLKDASGKDLKFDRGKTSLQLKRNASLKKARELVLEDEKGKGRDVKIEWQYVGSIDRAVVLGDEQVFLQKKEDMCGTFVAGFSHLTI